MTWLIIDHHRTATLATDDPLVATGDIAAFGDARSLLAGLDAVADGARARAHVEGLAAGRAAAAAEQAAALIALEARAATERAAMRAEAGDLAIAIVRRIAAGIGHPETVAALAASAAAELAPDAPAEARVAPDAVAATVARLGNRPQVTVIADPALAPTDCMLTTPLGSIRAGLETQLAAIGAALSQGAHDAR